MNTNNPTVAELRKNGFKVRVIHKRFSIQDFKRETIKFLRNNKDVLLYSGSALAGNMRSPKGGRTIVEVTFADGTEGRGVADCSPADAFNRKIGLGKALERALAVK